MYQQFRAISDPLRFEIVMHLSANEHAVGELALALGHSQPNISKALRVLRDADLVHVRKVGQSRYYSLRRDRFAEIARWVLGVARPANQSTQETQ